VIGAADREPVCGANHTNVGLSMKRKKLTVLRWSVRLLCLGTALFLALGGPAPNVLRRLFPGLSPLVGVTNVVVSWSWYHPLYWGLPMVAVLAIAIFRGRFFCRWICPAGTAYGIAGALPIKKPLIRRRFNGFVFWTIVSGGLAGLPFLLALDPLSSFNRVPGIASRWYGIAALVPGLLVPLFLLLGAIQPLVWCTHFCPLGYLFDLVNVKRRKPLIHQKSTRREIVFGMAVGLPLALARRKLGLVPAEDDANLPILPPGATTPAEFASLCTRCYACVEACPTGVITVGSPARRKLMQFFQPELDTDAACCEEFCNRCTEVCPAGALTPLAETDKRRRKIGTAKVIKEACLAWAKDEYCTVCDEYCPYYAVEMGDSPSGVPSPVVDPDICRGCGACQASCPAKEKGKAIIVEGIAEQRIAKEFELPPL